MTKTEKINKHPGWRLSRSEKNWYYLGDSARLFCTALINTYMTTFLIFQGVNMASLAGAILLVKIIDSVDDVLFGFIIDKIDITKGKLFSKIAGKGKYMPWYRLFFWTFPVATILFFMMPKDSSDIVKIIWINWNLICWLQDLHSLRDVMGRTAGAYAGMCRKNTGNRR